MLVPVLGYPELLTHILLGQPSFQASNKVKPSATRINAPGSHAKTLTSLPLLKLDLWSLESLVFMLAATSADLDNA
jgi:hypothetical protein